MRQSFKSFALAALACAVLSACGSGEEESSTLPSSLNKAVPLSTYWSGVARAMPTSPLGNKVGMSCHNCYGNSLAATNAKVNLGLNRQFDLIELDLTQHADGKVYVEHDDSESARGTLTASLANVALQQSDRMLFLEVKEAYSTTALSDSMMRSILRDIRDGGYASAARPAFLRAFMDGRQNHLIRAKQLLAQAEFASIRNHVRFHTLIQSDIRNNVRATKNLGFHGVEFEYRTSDLFGKIMQAKHLGLGVGLYTIPASMGEAHISGLREDVDFITTDYDLGSTPEPDNVRQLIEDNTSLLYLNASQQSGYPLSYRRTNAAIDHQFANSSAMPTLEWLSAGADEDRVGGSLVFNGAQQHITTWDADNTSTGGFLVTAVVNFDDLSPSTTASLLAKSDSSGFTLEQHGSVLRFGVHVNGNYHYATAPLSGFNGTDSYFILGAYDGNGAVRLWVNNREKTASASVSGGVTQNNSPIVIGADPQGSTDRRFFFKGKIQQVMVQKWRDH